MKIRNDIQWREASLMDCEIVMVHMQSAEE